MICLLDVLCVTVLTTVDPGLVCSLSSRHHEEAKDAVLLFAREIAKGGLSMNLEYIQTISDVRMPKIIYGTAWKKEKTADLVYQAVSLGFRGIDTACQPKHYHEAGVGQALKRLEQDGIKRRDIFLQSKFTSIDGQDPSRVPYDPQASLQDQVQQSFASSQKNLGCEYLDSLVLHGPLRTFQQTMVVWRAMEGLYRKGAVRQLGISNCYNLPYLKKLYDEAEIKPAVIQNRFYSETDYDKSLREWSNSEGLYYQSFWTLTANPHILKSVTLDSIAEKYHKTAAQIFFRFLTQSNIVPLTGTSSVQHMQEDLAIFGFSLLEEELKWIEGEL